MGQPPLILLALLLLTTQGFATTPQPNLNVTKYPHVGMQDSMCSRSHTNTAFIGVEPYSTIVVPSAGDCFKNCIENYPRCTAVVFYNLHVGDLRNVCFSFDRNSVDENVALIPEQPVNQYDEIRAFEIAPYCYYFNPVPPLTKSYIDSTDHVSQTKRTSQYWATNTVYGEGSWSKWTQCSPKSPQQIRSQKCEYGRLINRRPCIYGSMYPTYRTSVIIHVNIPYPPMPYIHPECYSYEFDEILTRHLNEMRRICCVRNDNATREVKSPHPEIFVPNCRQICTQPLYNMSLDADKSNFERVHTSVNDVPEGWTEWSSWSICSATCDYGTEQRSRECQGGNCMGNSYEVRPCEGLPPCKTWSEWTPYTECPVTCGMGEITRSRFCYLGRNRCAGEDFEVTTCNLQPCAVWGMWSEWTDCEPCGTSEVTRSRSCFGVGSCLGPSVEHKQCNLQPCATWLTWGEWSSCSTSCGAGVKQRRRICSNGDKCEGQDMEEGRCNNGPCAEWEPWSAWSTCSVTCGYGYELRTRTCMGYSEECEGESYELQTCSAGECAGYWSEWQPWSECKKDLAEQTRRRVCLGPENSCEPGDSIEVRNCAPKQNNIWGEWTPWSECPPCISGIATTYRSRICTTSWCDGFAQEERACESPFCSTWETWSEWSECTETCGNGKRYRSRLCLYGNDCVGPSEDTDQCENNPPCGGWAPWSEWSPCSSQCGVGQKTRERVCNNGEYMGASCVGPSTQTVQCLDRPCCEWSNWDKWMPCDRSCGDGKQHRVRQCQRPGDESSTCQCPGQNMQYRDCHQKSCAVRTQTVTRVNHSQSRFDMSFNKDNRVVELNATVPQPTRGDRTNDYPGYAPHHYHEHKPTVTKYNGSIGTGAIYNPEAPVETALGPMPTFEPLGYRPRDCLPYGNCYGYNDNVNNFNYTGPTTCQWSSWCNWTPCPNSCDYGLTRRHRYCLGDNRCACEGGSVEKMHCSDNEECKRKRKKK